MGWRFRKSVKILPGVRLNFGKKGLTSATIGSKYAKTNISKRGTYNTYSLPGTGISYRTEISGGQTLVENNYLKPLSEVYWNCPRCLMVNLPQNRYCEGCTAENPKLKFQTNGIYWYCKQCYTGNNPENSICDKCGDAYAPNPQQIAKYDGSAGKIVGFLVIGIIFLIVTFTIVKFFI